MAGGLDQDADEKRRKNTVSSGGDADNQKTALLRRAMEARPSAKDSFSAPNTGTPMDDWAAKEAAHLATLNAQMQHELLTKAEAVYEQRRFDNENLVRDNAAELHRLQREEHDRKVDEKATKNAKVLAAQANAMRGQKERLEANGQDPLDIVNQRVNERAEGRPGSGDHYGRALREQNDQGDPYGIMARAAMAEFAAFRKDQEAFAHQIENAPNLDTRHSLEQKKDIQAAEYLASTCHRIADKSGLISGHRNGDEANSYREQAAQFENEAHDLRENYWNRTRQDPFAKEEAEPTVRDRASDDSRSKRQEAEQEALHSSRPSDKYEWTGYQDKLTDRQKERLNDLTARNEPRDGEKTNDRERPSRPVGRGAEV